MFQTETPQGLLRFALRRELIEGGSPEPEEALAGLGAVTADDVHRVAAELFAGPVTARAHQAVRRPGPFRAVAVVTRGRTGGALPQRERGVVHAADERLVQDRPRVDSFGEELAIVHRSPCDRGRLAAG